MIIKKTITIPALEKEVTDDILCNMCTRSLKSNSRPGIDKEHISCDGLVEAKTQHGYGSLKDGDTYIFSLCEGCLDKISPFSS